MVLEFRLVLTIQEVMLEIILQEHQVMGINQHLPISLQMVNINLDMLQPIQLEGLLENLLILEQVLEAVVVLMVEMADQLQE